MNVDNINKLIGWLKDDQAKHFKMDTWAQYNSPDLYRSEEDRHLNSVREVVECQTSFCLGGHIIYQLERAAGKAPKDITFWGRPFHEYYDKGEEFLDIDRHLIDQLFMMHNDEEARERFDELPDEQRSEIAIKVLEHLRDNFEVDWYTFLPFDTNEDDEDEDEDEDY